MLAQRASSSPELKGLMKIVASGSATAEQLKMFQSHIDELTALSQRQAAAKEAKEKEALAKKQATSVAVPPPVPPPPPSAATAAAPTPAAAAAPASTPQPIYNAPTPFITNATFHSQHATFAAHSPSNSTMFNPNTMRPSPSAPPKIEILGIAIEFNSGSGDRYLLPKHSIMQHAPAGRQALLSFLLVRRSESSEDGKSGGEEFFQPVTIRVWSDQPRIFDSIARSLAPADEVRASMEEVMSKTKRAEIVQLAIQLPRESEGSGEQSSRASTPVQPKGPEKRQSLLRASLTTQSLTADVSTKPAKEKANPFMEQHCMYCFEQVAAPIQKLEGKTICPSCSALRKTAIMSAGLPLDKPIATRRVVRPMQSIML